MVTKILAGGIEVKVDGDGFLQEPDKWNEQIAEALAKSEGIEKLTNEHWKIVNFIRKYYLEFGTAPLIRRLIKETGIPLAGIYELFPSGPAKGACKVAGLKKPTGCV